MHIMGGNSTTNLRQTIQKELIRRGERCRCIRCREIRNRNNEKPEWSVDNVFRREYKSSGGREIFLSYESKENRKINDVIWRKSQPFGSTHVFPEIAHTALVRELHVYVFNIHFNFNFNLETQHSGFGKRLMRAAEKEAIAAGFKGISVIAGVGTREYYRKRGYTLEGTYMVKRFPIWQPLEPYVIVVTNNMFTSMIVLLCVVMIISLYFILLRHWSSLSYLPGFLLISLSFVPFYVKTLSPKVTTTHNNNLLKRNIETRNSTTMKKKCRNRSKSPIQKHILTLKKNNTEVEIAEAEKNAPKCWCGYAARVLVKPLSKKKDINRGRLFYRC
eukprot:GSMAST32.ASY1.ANO1.442.1 assembled CDS